MLSVYGTVCLDRVHQIDRLPTKGGYAEIKETRDLLGGEAANTATALHRWGSEVQLFSNALGSGPDADLLRKLLRETGMTWKEAAAQIPTAPICDIYVTPDGERTMFGRGFSTMENESADVTVPVVPEAWMTLDSNHGGSARRLARRAVQEGAFVYLLDFIRSDDPREAGMVWQSSTDWAGQRENTAANLDFALKLATEHGVYVVLTDGDRGLVTAIPSGERRYLPAYALTGVVDTTGAGDAFRAGVLSALDEGQPWGAALSFGAAAGALNSLASGAINPELTRERIETLRAEQRTLTNEFCELESPYQPVRRKLEEL